MCLQLFDANGDKLSVRWMLTTYGKEENQNGSLVLIQVTLHVYASFDRHKWMQKVEGDLTR